MRPPTPTHTLHAQQPGSRHALALGPKAARALLFVFLLAAAASAQGQAAEPGELVVEGRQAGDVFAFGRTIRVRGDVNGVIAFGGDVVIEGRVEGDAAAIGGSVVQQAGSFVGGDVMVLGGAYRNLCGEGCRGPGGHTYMVAGFENELREAARNPATLLTPEFSVGFLGWRLVSVLFWFAVSLALTSVTPGAVGRAAARLQTTSPRVALIGLVGAVVVGPGATAALHLLPPMLGGLVFATALLVLLFSFVFGRVVVNAVTGRWLQRVLLPEGRRSESVALLLGAAFWSVALSLPYVWPLVVAGLVVLSLGLSLTARYRINWRRA
ncbi:MAG TPA: polymer-forming cytoskeletal protein [Pyrinomonadaceae bacterium]|jgi:hypothetical protein|nr:polymer-forming cytoskeletal protein [Pyrinomonadaceae bacterium]